MMDEDWNLLASFFPADWETLAVNTCAVKGLRKDKSAGDLLRTVMIHFACGHSLRETAVRARKANLADLSAVALLKRVRKCTDWLHSLCVALFNERGLESVGDTAGRQFRVFDATTVKEPGKTGSLWRIHYSVRIPSLTCDFFKITETKGPGTGESFSQFPIETGDYIIADRGYSTPTGVHYVASHGAFVCVRVNSSSLVMLDSRKTSFVLADRLKPIAVSGDIGSWSVCVPGPDGAMLPGRLCVVRKTEEAIRLAHKKLRRRASKKGEELQPETLFLAQYVILFTTFPAHDFTPSSVLEWYRIRWQIELVFKRFKQIAQLGHLPKHEDESVKAWLYGKLFAALVTEKIIAYASSVSPWGYNLEGNAAAKQMA